MQVESFHPQTQKLESPYKTPSNTLAVKGLKVTCPTRNIPIPDDRTGLFLSRECVLIPHLGDQILKVTCS